MYYMLKCYVKFLRSVSTENIIYMNLPEILTGMPEQM